MSYEVPTFYLRPDQEEAVEAIVAALQTDERTQAIMACGTGKTFTGQRAAERITKALPDALILVTVPNMVLVDQLMREWINQADSGFDFQAQPVVSEAASPDTRAAAAKRDEAVTGFELRNNTTDVDLLARFMLGTGRRVIFSTYHSSGRIAEAVAIAKESRPGFAIDLIVADEAHRTAGPGFKSEAGLFKTILDDEKIRSSRRLFMTATPRQGLVSKGEKDNFAFSMGNEEVYGSRAITRTLSWAVANGHLAPYRAFVAQVSDGDVENILRSDPTLRVSGSTKVVAARATQIAAAIVLVKAARQRDLGSIVTYHKSIAGARDFQTILAHVSENMPPNEKPHGSLTISHINGETSAEDRATFLATLDSAGRKPGDWAVVTNCNCLTEGVNVPSMDAIMLVDPRSSTVGIVQAVGRPMRKDPRRPDKVASILLPVFVGECETTTAAIESGAFATVYDALQALKDVDDALSDKFIQSLAEQAPTLQSGSLGDCRDINDGTSNDAPIDLSRTSYSGDSLPLLRIADSEGRQVNGQPGDASITLTTPASHGPAGSQTFKDHREWHKSIALRVIEDNATVWEQGLAALKSFIAEHGHARIVFLYACPDGFRLGAWVSNRRMDHAAGRLSEVAVSVLESLPGWVWDPARADALVCMEAFKEYVREFGHARVPQDYVAPGGAALGRWISGRRMAYKKGRISVEGIRELEALPEWAWNPRGANAQKFVGALRSYVSEHGSAKVHPDYTNQDGLKLGYWVARRRADYKAGRLSKEEVAEHESLPGWVWDAREGTWQIHMDALRNFVEAHGHAHVAAKYVSEDGTKLGMWIMNRRNELRRGILGAERVSELDECDTTWRRGALAPMESPRKRTTSDPPS